MRKSRGCGLAPVSKLKRIVAANGSNLSCHYLDVATQPRTIYQIPSHASAWGELSSD